MRVLMAYPTAEGVTTGVAERTGADLRRFGHVVDVLPVDDVTGVEDCDTVVLGSAVHDQRWLPEASIFLTRERASLARRPLWAFSVGMPEAFRGRTRDRVRAESDGLLHVEPQYHQLFSGVLRPARFERWRHLLFRLAGGKFGDFRDPAAIDRWAGRIARTPDRSWG